MDIDAKDNHRLYIEVADWIGTPYRHGGTTRKGTDCSGFTSAVYKKVYRHKLKRSSEEQRTKNCRKVAKRNLKEGDLVFFHNGRKKRKATHVGIYLKDGRFVHASTSRGSHRQPAGRRLLPPLLDAGRTGERHLTTTIHKHNRQ